MRKGSKRWPNSRYGHIVVNLYNPPFCPNPKCLFHKIGISEDILFREATHLTANTFYYRNGFYVLRGTKVARFRCRHCLHYFSERTFNFSHRFKKPDDGLSAKIFKIFIMSSSNRQLARHFHISPNCVRTRLDRMARWAMLIHRDKLKKLTKMEESICYDGLQNFAGSQYDPNYINQAVGQESLFIYDFNFAPLNRKGKMSDRQKLKKENIEQAYGKYPHFAVQNATAVLVRRLLKIKEALLDVDPIKVKAPLVICTDEHYQYKRAFKFDLKELKGCFDHVTVSAKATRNYQNILFAINHADMLIRHQVKAFTRETIAFSKTHAKMCQKFALFMVHKNYFSPQFTKAQKTRPGAHTQSPAQALGIENKVLKFYEFFKELRTVEQINPPEEWAMFMCNRVPYGRSLN